MHNNREFAELFGSTSTKQRQRRGKIARQNGYQVEAEAARWLQSQHQARIVMRNFRCKLGELDIIAICDDVLLFVEVRHRGNSRYSSAAESVDTRKQRKLVKTAKWFLLCKPDLADMPARFDVITSSGTGDGDDNFNWIKDAFQAD